MDYSSASGCVDWISGWFGTGVDRGIALVFTLTGLTGLTVSLFAMRNRSFQVEIENFWML